MNHLLSIRSNTLFSKEKEEYKKFHELILLVDKPNYISTNEGQIIRQRAIEEMRFIVSDKALEDLINSLNAIKNLGQ